MVKTNDNNLSSDTSSLEKKLETATEELEKVNFRLKELEKQKIKGLVDMFGRETPVELDFNQIKQLD